MSAIKNAAEMLRREAESMKACHTVGVGGEWYGESAKAEYDEMIAAADSAIAERDELRADKATLQHMTYSLKDRLEVAEKSDAESIAMYRKARDERDALRAKIETAENDAAHQKALADSALRVAKGWERKCGELRAKIERIDEAMESLLIRCDDSDSAMYGTLSTSFVRNTVRIARGALEESK